MITILGASQIDRLKHFLIHNIKYNFFDDDLMVL